MDYIISLYDQLSAMTNNNQVLSGVVALWGLTVVTWAMRNIPMSIYRTCKRQFITSMTLNNTTYASRMYCHNLMRWFEQNNYSNHSRTFKLSIKDPWASSDFDYNDDDKKLDSLSAGYGVHFFFYKWRLCWMTVNKLESSGSENQKEEITIYKLGRGNKILSDLVSEFAPKPKIDENFVYEYREGEWVSSSKIPYKNIDALALDDDKLDFINNTVYNFLNSREWFYERNIPFKMVNILSGKPGSGKTSIIKAIASLYDRNICVLRLNSVTDITLQTALTTLPKKSIVIIEDVDTYGVTQDRTPSGDDGDDKKFSFLTMSGLLNALQGIVELDDVIMFMTTNHLEKIDKAVRRVGRIDHVIEVNEMSECAIKSYSERMFPDHNFDDFEFKPMVGCHLNAAIIYARDDVEKYKSYIKEICDSGRNLESV